MAYLGKTPSQAVRSRYYFTASGGETSLSGTDDNSNTLTFTDGNYVDVNLNGVTLVAGTDYNTTTANTIGGLTALVASDVVEVIVYDTFSVFSGAFTGDISLGDNVKAKFGASDDLQIYHDGSNSIVYEGGTGTLKLATAGGSVDIVKGSDSSETMAKFNINGAAELYHDNSKKLETTSTGIDVTGTMTADGLTVNNSTVGDLITVTGANGTDLRIGNHASANGGIYINSQAASDDLRFRTQGSDRMTIDSSGNVGIGTSSIGAGLHIDNPSNSAITAILDTDNSAVKIVFRNNTETGNNVQIGADGSNLVALTNATERMRIDSSGNLLVGKTAHNATDQGIVANASGRLWVTTSSDDSIFNRVGTDGGLLSLRKNGSEVGSIGVVNSITPYIIDGSRGLRFNGNNIRPCSSGGANLDNTISLGDTGQRFKDLYLSGGVFLGGVGSANKLDDYEEGTWTPTLAQYGGSPTIELANYTKVGRLVTATCRIVLSGFSDASHFQVNGLPFTTASFGGAVQGGFITYSITTLSTPIRVLIGNNNTQASLYQYGGGNATYNDVGNSGDFRFMFVYMSA